jgi:tetratricopeptide (TPR) repeat protein
LDGRRTLIVLDNAGSAEQVRPLLPGAPGCFVVVTSRDDLAGLVVRDGATRVRLDLLTAEESVALLRRLLTPAVDSHPEAVDRLVRLCARLPLALRIAADRIVTDGAPLPMAVDGLARGGTLDTFAAGDDPYTALRAVFSWSYEALPAPIARMFRLVRLVPGDDWDVAAAAALAGCPAAEAQRLLSGLASAHLIEERDGPRYGMHDLLRVYATELADRDPDREAAWRRLCDHYLGTAAAAAERGFPSQFGLSRPALPSAAAFADADAAIGWLDANRAGIVAVAVRAAAAGPLAVAWQLVDVLHEYLLINRHTAEARTAGEASLAAARRADDVWAEAMMRYRLGALDRVVDDYPSARAHHQAALELFERIDDPDGQVAATIGLGTVCADVGELARARDLLGDGAVRARRQGLTDLAGIAFGALFNVHHGDGDLRAAVAAVTEAEEIFRSTANGRRLTPTLINRAVSLHMIGEYDRALEVVTEALTLSRRYGQRHYEASAQVVLALVALDVGRPDRALEHASEGLRLIQAAGLKEYEGAVWSALGWVYWVLGKYHHAVEHHTRCLEFGRETGFLLSELQGHIGLASSHHRLGNLDIALEHARRAMYHARERQFLLTECETSQLLAVISAEQGDPLTAEHHMARADQIKRDTGFQPAPYMPTL